MRSTEAGDPGTEYLERARAFVPELAAAAPEIERQRELPESIVAAMVERGFFRMLLPRSLGGAELPPAPYVRVVEEIAKGDASAAWCLNQGAGCSMTAAYLDPAAAKEVFGGPRGILAWGPGPGKARIVDGGYRVTATWSFASGSHNATWPGCHVPIYDVNGRQLLHADGSPVVRTPIFPKSCAEMTDIWHVMGLRGTGSDKYSVTDLFVPAGFSRRATTATAVKTACSTASAACSSMPRGLPGWRWVSPAARSTPLPNSPATRCRSAVGKPCATTMSSSQM